MSSASPSIKMERAIPKIQFGLFTKTPTLVLLIVWTISIGYMAMHLNRTWVPHDEGTLGLSAERVLDGELPHRDFDDYTGGLTFVHALAFRELGISSMSMRIVLFAFFVLWVPTLFYLASRFGSPYSAGAVTLLAVAWSVPNYPGPMPSWYNLFFATFGTAALLRYIEVGTRRWLLIAGICGGFSFLAKITAAYFVAGVLLFFVFREQCITSEHNPNSPTRARFYSATVALALVAFLALLFSMVHQVPGIAGLVYFVLPAFILIVFLLAREFAGIAGQSQERFLTLFNMCVPFGVGIAIPLMLFLIPYVRAGSVHDLLAGLVGTPVRAIHFELLAPANPTTMLAVIPFAIPLMIGYECGRVGRAICGSFVALYACVVLIYAERSSSVYSLGWYSLTTVVPLLALAATVVLWQSSGQRRLSLVHQQQIMLVMCVALLCSVVQFPFAMPIYFCYVAPLVILAAMALFAAATRPPRFVLGTLLAFYLLFVVVRVTPRRMGLQALPDSRIGRLTIPRAGGLLVESTDAQVYDQLIPLIQKHAEGKFIYAVPDCPEVYFLSGLKSPTRYSFALAEGPASHANRILEMLASLKINVIAVNKEPRFSHVISADMQSAFEERYPNAEDIGKFQVRWK
jgi:hypothetical protein